MNQSPRNVTYLNTKYMNHVYCVMIPVQKKTLETRWSIRGFWCSTRCQGLKLFPWCDILLLFECNINHFIQAIRYVKMKIIKLDWNVAVLRIDVFYFIATHSFRFFCISLEKWNTKKNPKSVLAARTRIKWILT